MLNKTSGTVAAAIATAAGTLVTGQAASAQADLVNGWHGRHHPHHHSHYNSHYSRYWNSHHSRHWNSNRNRPRIFIRIYIYNKNNNVAVAAPTVRRRDRDDDIAPVSRRVAGDPDIDRTSPANQGDTTTNGRQGTDSAPGRSQG